MSTIGLIRFAFTFAILYGGFQWLYFLIPDRYLIEIIYPNVIGSFSAAVVNALVPGEQVWVQGGALISQHARLEIVRGCDGAGALFMVTAAVLAYAANWRWKLLGLLLGGVLVYALNIIRIVAMYFIAAHYTSWFVPAHTLVAPGFIVLLVCLYFAFWASSTRARAA